MGMNIVICSGAVDFLRAETGDRRFMVVYGKPDRTNHADRVTADSLKGLITRGVQGARPLLWAHLATPPIGTPSARTQGGNSTPMLAPVAAVWKSEQVGERGAEK